MQEVDVPVGVARESRFPVDPALWRPPAQGRANALFARRYGVQEPGMTRHDRRRAAALSRRAHPQMGKPHGGS